MNFTDSKKKLLICGAACGIIAAALAYFGNPTNMAFCIACFVRDIAGAMGMHQAAAVQYVRPEVIGMCSEPLLFPWQQRSIALQPALHRLSDLF